MKPPRFTDARRRYRTAEESRAPGYLARRLKAYARLQRIKEAKVTPLRKAAK
jgi:hypothetical protein